MIALTATYQETADTVRIDFGSETVAYALVPYEYGVLDSKASHGDDEEYRRREHDRVASETAAAWLLRGRCGS